MRALLIVLLDPGLDDLSRLLHGAEPPPVQAAVAEDAVEALVPAVLPRAAGLDVMRLHADLAQPLLQLLGDELRTVVTADIGRRAVEGKKLGQLSLDLCRRDRARAVDPKGDPRELIDHRQAAQPAPVRRLVRHEIVAPDVVRIRRLRPRHIWVVLASPTPLAPAQRQAFLPAQAPYLLAPDAKALLLQPLMDLAVAKARVALGEPVQSCEQLCPVIAHLGAALA